MQAGLDMRTCAGHDVTRTPAVEAGPASDAAGRGAAPRRRDRLPAASCVKREDQSGLGLGGNKPRQLEVILADAKAKGCDTIVTTAAAQSNFCRATAAACATLGWRCVLLLRGQADAPVVGNLLLDHLFGAEVHWIDTTDPYSDAIQQRLDALLDAAHAAGHAPYLVRLPGVTGPLAAAAAASLADEILSEAEAPPDWVVLAAGSGLTAAGLLAGFAGAGVATRVMAISVQQPTDFIAPLILRRAREAAALLDISADIDAVAAGGRRRLHRRWLWHSERRLARRPAPRRPRGGSGARPGL